MYRSVLVPLDGSELAETILSELDHIAISSSTRMILIRVCPVHAVAERYASESHSRIVQAAEAYLENMKALLNAKGFTVEVHVCYGDPALEILDLADRADVSLIAMSTHGRSGLGRWLLGSVAEKVVRHSNQPVLLKPVK
ncbi:MAG: universal stress protein [Desulfobacteraceae bacterium]